MTDYSGWIFLLYFASFSAGFVFLAISVFAWRNLGNRAFREIALFLVACIVFNAIDLLQVYWARLVPGTLANLVSAPLDCTATAIRSLQALFLLRLADSLAEKRLPAFANAILYALIFCFPAYLAFAMANPGLALLSPAVFQNGTTIAYAFLVFRLISMRASLTDPDIRLGVNLAVIIGTIVIAAFGVIDDNFLKLYTINPAFDNIDHHLLLLIWGIAGIMLGGRAFRIRFRQRIPYESLADHFAAHKLSARECEIASLMAEGLSNGEIAARLFISLPTVKTHAFRFFKKLGIRNRVELRYLAGCSVTANRRD